MDGGFSDMALSGVLAYVTPAAILIGLIGSLLLLWARPSALRYLGATMLPILVAALVLASWPIASQIGPAPALIAALAVGILGYGLFLFASLKYVGNTAGVSSRLHEYDTLLDATRRERDAMLKEKELQQKLPAKIAARFQLPDDEKRHIVLVQGEISEILNSVVRPDVVINSENDFMMLGRLFDKNFSGTLRYLDAEKDPGHNVTIDTLEKRLDEKLTGIQRPVRLGAVFETETVGLRKLGVKYVLHVATVQPLRQGGFVATPGQIPFFIQSCFAKYRELLRDGKDITTMLFPLIGAGDGGVSSEDSAREMVPSIVSQMNSHMGIRETYVVAFRQGDLQALLEAAKASNLVTEQ